MIIEQFYDKGLAHGSYIIISNNQAAVIDPARDPQPYYDFVDQHNAKIVCVIETHPHADFVSSHLEIANQTGASIYASKLLGADYHHQAFDNGDSIQLGNIKLNALNTPGHSPDSICILLVVELGKQQALFSGDTLFVGDVGRPDLRESTGNISAKREELARAMFHSVHTVLKKLDQDVVVYPAHGAGSLCGKNLSTDLSSTIGREINSNYAFSLTNEEEFVQALLEDQPFVPKYFGYAVQLNKAGAPSFEESVKAVPRIAANSTLQSDILVIDTRKQSDFRDGHLPNAINLMDGGKFETWLGSIVAPNEPFYLIAENELVLESVIRKAAKIGYESFIKGALTTPNDLQLTAKSTDYQDFRENPDRYTNVDIRNIGEVNTRRIFPNALEIPLPELRERLNEIPTGKPIMVHCAGGYRSAAGASIIQPYTSEVVFDLSDEISKY
jgi:glyoxylase-like metal-dependent hydrolase (beta-lactamase superfamily II)/rhodanese-related sulfurtransferase